MAQEFSLRLPLADGQGNFGSIDGDPPAAMRYTEIRLTEVAGFLLDDLDKETVDFRPNYDNQEFEPIVLPAKLPNLLVNGAGGIAVGMATNIPPHNLGEVINACLALIDNPNLSIMDLIAYIPAPDFPTAGLILGRSGAMSGYVTGRGSVIMRGRIAIEERSKDRQAIIITELPYQVNKAHLVEKIAELVRDKRIEGISDLRDESDRQGMRVAIDLKKDANSDVIINQLYKWTALQSSFGMNMLALNEGRPEQLNLKEILAAFLAFREQVVIRRTKFELNKARERAHLLVGLAAAVANLDEVVLLIKSSPDPKTAKAALLAKRWNAGDMIAYIRLVDDPRHPIDDDGFYHLSERQAQAILDLRLHRLTALGRDEITEELKKLADSIADYLTILASRERIMTLIKDELVMIRDKFATPRKSEIIEYEGDMDDEDLIPSEDMIVTVTKAGYVMRVPVDTYRAQNRGGRGRSGMNTRDEDGLETIFTANTHDSILFFSDKGMVYKLRVWRLPVGSLTARGKAMINLLPIASDERITTILCSPRNLEASDDTYVMFATASGNVRRNPLSDFMSVRVNGKIAMKLDDGDSLVGVKICHDNSDIVIATAFGKVVRFHALDIRLFKSRDSDGVRGVRLAEGDRVVSIAELPNIDVTSEESVAYLKKMRALRKSDNDIDDTDTDIDTEEESVTDIALSDERFAELSAHSVMILTMSNKGFGKRTDSFAYRRMNRGGQGSTIMKLRKDAEMIIACPVSDTDDVIAATDGGQVIRFRAADISIQSRTASGVTLVRMADDEKIVSVTVIPNDDVVGDDDMGVIE
jgi:DNA gyrase subunit A